MKATKLFYELTEALSTLTYVHPFFSSIIYDKLTIVVDPPPGSTSTPILTLGVDGMRLYVNSVYFKKLTQQQRVAAIAHEVFHAMYLHCQRIMHYMQVGLDGQRVNPMGMNFAADFIINDGLKHFGIGEIHPDWLWSSEVKYTETMEEVYRRIMPPPPPPGGGGQGQPGQGSGQGQQPGGGQGQGGNQPGQGGGQGQQPGKGDYHLQTGKGNEKIKSDGQFDTHFQQPSDHSEEEWASTIEAAMQGAKAIGKLPADMERMLKDWLTIKKNWKEILSDNIRARAGFDNRNTKKANRRRLYQDRVYIPSRYSWQIEKVGFIFDVSGSISLAETELAMGTTKDILEQCPTKELRCLCVNSQVMDDVTFTSLDEFMAWRPHGSGGTDMEAGFRHFEEDSWIPDVCIVLTDGYTNTSPENEPPFSVIWVTTGSEDLTYGRVIKMDISEAVKDG